MQQTGIGIKRAVLAALVAAAIVAVTGVAFAPSASACKCGPYAPPLTSTGVGTEVQTVTIVAPPDGSAQLLDNLGNPVTTWDDPAGAGTYRLDATTGTISFAPALGFVGSPAPENVVSYRLIDEYSDSDDGTYTPTVTAPEPPVAAPLTSVGNQGAAQVVALTVPQGGSVTLLDGAGDPATTVAVAGQGTYVLDPTTGIVTFSPLAGLVGDASPVAYRVTDAYDQATEGVLSIQVLAAAAEPTPTTTTTTAAPAPTTAARASAGTLPATGSTSLPLLLGGAMMLIGGTGMVVLARRRLATDPES